MQNIEHRENSESATHQLMKLDMPLQSIQQGFSQNPKATFSRVFVLPCSAPLLHNTTDLSIYRVATRTNVTESNYNSLSYSIWSLSFSNHKEDKQLPLIKLISQQLLRNHACTSPMHTCIYVTNSESVSDTNSCLKSSHHSTPSCLL